MKNKKQNNSATNELIDALFSHQICEEKPGPGWFCAWDIADKYRISRSHATKKIKEFVRDGLMEVKKFRVSGRVVPHYKAIKGISRPCKQ